MYLYVFGGWARDTVERVSIVDISQKQWEWAGYLTATAYQPRCASRGDNIYIVGGCSCVVSSSPLNIVHVMDTSSVTMYGTIAVLNDPMPYPGLNVAPIVVDGVLYVFGGLKDADGNGLDKLAYYMLRTATPTNVASDEPSAAPTRPPSAAPTVVASDDPSAAPTRLPSAAPTVAPSHDPSAAPLLCRVMIHPQHLLLYRVMAHPLHPLRNRHRRVPPSIQVTIRVVTPVIARAISPPHSQVTIQARDRLYSPVPNQASIPVKGPLKIHIKKKEGSPLQI
eukprot:492542_1